MEQIKVEKFFLYSCLKTMGNVKAKFLLSHPRNSGKRSSINKRNLHINFILQISKLFLFVLF